MEIALLESLTRTESHVDRARTRRRSASRRRWEFDTSEPLGLGEIRAAFVGDPRSRALDAGDAELVIGELLGNVVRYAPGPGYVEIEWLPDAVTISVADSGPGFTDRSALPLDPFAESGRGLYLVRVSSREFTVTRSALGGSRVCAIVPTPARVSARS